MILAGREGKGSVVETETLISTCPCEIFPNEESHDAWYVFRNIRTQQKTYVRVNVVFGTVAPMVSVTSVIFESDTGNTVKAGDLIGFPLAEIVSYLSDIYLSKSIADKRTLCLRPAYGDRIGTSAPLPHDIKHDEVFFALVAEQFEAIRKAQPTADPVRTQSKINKVSESTIRSWLSTARKMGVLMPIAKGRRPVASGLESRMGEMFESWPLPDKSHGIGLPFDELNRRRG